MPNNIYNQKKWIDRFIYEKPRDSFDEDRVSKILEAIPQDVGTVLDIGAGGGFIFRELKNRINLTCFGIDISLELVGRLKEKNICVGDVRDIPFKDEEFDLVLAGDLLEHLEEKYFEKGVSEMTRVSKKYILISSPYKDEVNWPVSLCGSCGREFNVYGHMRRIDMGLIKRIFPVNEFDFKKIEILGKPRDPRPSPLVYMARRWGRVYSQEGVVCPHCFKTCTCQPSRNLFERSLGKMIAAIFYLLDNFIPPVFKSGSEILILLEKHQRCHK